MVKDFEQNIYSESLVAGADLSTKQYFNVKLNSNGKVVLAGAGDFSIGVLMNDPKENEIAQVMILGTTPVVYGDAITAGELVKSDVNGKAVVSGTGEHYVVGVALESGAAGEYHSIILIRFNKA